MVKVLKFSVIALSDIAVGFLLLVVGVGTNGWVVVDRTDTGLGLKDTASELYPSEDRSKGQAAYALCIISTLAASAALVAISINVIMQVIEKENEKLMPMLLLVTLIAAEIAGAFGIIGSIIHVAWQATYYSTKSKSYSYSVFFTSTSWTYNPGYSFFLTIIGSISLIVGGVLARKAKKGGQVIGE